MIPSEGKHSVTTEILTTQASIRQIAQFTNGKIKEKNSDALSFGQFVKCNDDRKRKHAILVGETKEMSYVGKNFGPDASKAQSYCRYYLGVVDKKHGKMRVYDAEIVQMVPKLPDYQEDEEKEKLDLSINMDKTYKQKIDDLTASFGSKKKKQAMGSRLRNEIRGEALEKALSSAVDDAVTQYKTQDRIKPEEEQSSILPPYNKDAAKPVDVYSLTDIISPLEMEVLSVPAQKFYDCKRDEINAWEKSQQYPKYILNHLAVLPSASDRRWKMCKMLMYLHYMVQLYTKNAKELNSRDLMPQEWPVEVKEKLLKSFTLLVDSGTKKTRCMPSRLKDKLLLHILIICLMTDEFELPLNDLQKDLKIGTKSLELHVKCLGCNVKSQTLVEDDQKFVLRSAVLTVPLKFPEVISKKNKSRR